MSGANRYHHIDELPNYWREAEARYALATWESSGLTLREFAEAHRIRLAKLRRWRRRLSEPTTVRFLDILPNPTVAPVEPFRLHLGEVVVEVPPGFRAEELTRLLEALSC